MSKGKTALQILANVLSNAKHRHLKLKTHIQNVGIILNQSILLSLLLMISELQVLLPVYFKAFSEIVKARILI